MIFVTVGTHEQQFNRLLKEIDKIKENGLIKDDVFIQSGYSNYVPKHCEWCDFLPYSEMEKRIKQADIVITHGGPASFMKVLSMGKIPVVVPRLKKFDEHVNNHQYEFCSNLKNVGYNMEIVENISTLFSVIKKVKYDTNVNNKLYTNNNEFINKFKKVVDEMFKR